MILKRIEELGHDNVLLLGLRNCLASLTNSWISLFRDNHISFEFNEASQGKACSAAANMDTMSKQLAYV